MPALTVEQRVHLRAREFQRLAADNRQHKQQNDGQDMPNAGLLTDHDLHLASLIEPSFSEVEDEERYPENYITKANSLRQALLAFRRNAEDIVRSNREGTAPVGLHDEEGILDGTQIEVEERNSDQDSVSSGLSTMGVAESRLTSLSQPKLIGNTIQRGTREHRQTRQASALAESPGESVGPKKETESLFNHWPPYNDSVRAVEMPTITPPSPPRIETPIQQRHNSLEDDGGALEAVKVLHAKEMAKIQHEHGIEMDKIRREHKKEVAGIQNQHRHDLTQLETQLNEMRLQNRNTDAKLSDLMAREKSPVKDVKEMEYNHSQQELAKQKYKSWSRPADEKNDSFVLPEPSRDPVLTHGNLERFEDLRKKATNTKWMRDARRQLWDED